MSGSGRSQESFQPVDERATLLDALFRLHEGLPRQGPGSDRATLAALGRILELPPKPRVLDLGCGAGRQTLTLARALGTAVVAVDIHQPFLDQLERAAAAQGMADLVIARQADMGNLGCRDETFDLVWSEGAAYLLGFREALRAWRRLLRPRGHLVVSECTWLTESPPADVAAFWGEAYPGMATVAGNAAVAAEAGYRVLDTLPLPARDWWSGYYGPLRERIAALRADGRVDPALGRAIADSEREMALFERAGDAYGYVFFVLQRTGERK